MSRSHTRIRRMWRHGGSTAAETVLIIPDRLDGRTFGKGQPVLVLPDDPAARAAMVARVMASKTPHWEARGVSRHTVELILATALTP